MKRLSLLWLRFMPFAMFGGGMVGAWTSDAFNAGGIGYGVGVIVGVPAALLFSIGFLWAERRAERAQQETEA